MNRTIDGARDCANNTNNPVPEVTDMFGLTCALAAAALAAGGVLAVSAAA